MFLLSLGGINAGWLECKSPVQAASYQVKYPTDMRYVCVLKGVHGRIGDGRAGNAVRVC